MAPQAAVPLAPCDDGGPATASLVIGNRREDLARAHAWLHAQAAAWGLSPDTLHRLDLGLEETVLNIISHAHPAGGEHAIGLCLSADAERVRLRVDDGGIPFNPLLHPPPTPAASLAAAPVGGLGIHLLRGMLAACEYRRENGRNVLTLTALRTPAR